MKGVRSVQVNRKQSHVVVSGYVEPNKVLKRIKSTGKRAEFWPYVPYNLVAYPYVSQAYDKKHYQNMNLLSQHFATPAVS
ncbi:Heavy metal-associated isoprenylated plant protein 20 [Ranunculus cassubicifolius]